MGAGGLDSECWSRCGEGWWWDETLGEDEERVELRAGGSDGRTLSQDGSGDVEIGADGDDGASGKS